MRQVVLGLGGNVGNVVETLKASLVLIDTQIGKIDLKSNLYKTQAWGEEDQPDFLNMVISCNTSLMPEQVLENCLIIEKQLGRNRIGVKKWRERLIDVDVLFYDDVIINTIDLILPHPYLHQRNFVLYPLTEILPNLIHPKFNKTMLQLKLEVKDNQLVSLLKHKI